MKYLYRTGQMPKGFQPLVNEFAKSRKMPKLQVSLVQTRLGRIGFGSKKFWLKISHDQILAAQSAPLNFYSVCIDRAMLSRKATVEPAELSGLPLSQEKEKATKGMRVSSYLPGNMKWIL